MKKHFALLLALLLTLSLSAVAEESPLPQETPADQLGGLLFTATVEPARELAVKAPAGGELAPFTLAAGDTAAAGQVLMSLQPQTVYAEADGTVAAVYIAAGDAAAGAMNRYGVAMYIDHADRYQFTGTVSNSRNTVENRDLHVGTPVYFRSGDKDHTAEGVITHVDGRNFTAQVLGGDLDFTERLEVFRDSEYSEAARLSEGRLTALAPYGVAASGTVLTVLVKPGDPVRAGDALFTFVPDTLAPENRSLEAATQVTAPEDCVVLSVAAQQGGTVQKGQLLATVCPLGDYRLVINAEEGDVHRFTPGAKLTVTFEELELPPVEATVDYTGLLGTAGDVSTYPVYLHFTAPEGVLLGMHATVEGAAQ